MSKEKNTVTPTFNWVLENYNGPVFGKGKQEYIEFDSDVFLETGGGLVEKRLVDECRKTGGTFLLPALYGDALVDIPKADPPLPTVCLGTLTLTVTGSDTYKGLCTVSDYTITEEVDDCRGYRDYLKRRKRGVLMRKYPTAFDKRGA